MKRFFQSLFQNYHVGFQHSDRKETNYGIEILKNSIFLSKSRVSRYLICNLSFSINEIAGEESSPLEILFVVAKKDAKFLSYSIRGALRSTIHHKIIAVTVICPRADLELIKVITDSIDKSIRVVAEDQIIGQIDILRIKDSFGPRGGWVLQQLIKVYYAHNSKSPGILIVDADTVLLKNRLWLDSNSTQILLPTWERNDPYYDFILTNSFKLDTNSLSHIAHHMVIQPKILRQMLNEYGLEDFSTLLHKLSQSVDSGDSPFSIDYEMYAQYLLVEHPNLVRYEKWSNFSVQKILDGTIDSCLKAWGRRFCSISAHSYNQN
jgi:hypothetical protein